MGTPGHTPEHLSFYWEAQRALFAGDHLLGKGNTTWVADYPGCISDYLNSIDRLRMLRLSVIYPAHGPPIENPTEALDRFERHRLARIQQVEEALEHHPVWPLKSWWASYMETLFLPEWSARPLRVWRRFGNMYRLLEKPDG